MIDKIVSAFLDDVWGTIVRNEEARQTRLQAVSTRRLATCDDVKAIPSTAQVTCIVATPDERWTFAGTKKGSILAINPRQWYSVSSTTVIDEKMSVAVMQVEMMGDCAYVLAVGMKEDGGCAVFSVPFPSVLLFHPFQYTHYYTYPTGAAAVTRNRTPIPSFTNVNAGIVIPLQDPCDCTDLQRLSLLRFNHSTAPFRHSNCLRMRKCLRCVAVMARSLSFSCRQKRGRTACLPPVETT
eukprot:Opistho-2@43869